MAINLIDRVIVITGASSGIGAATALACASAGMHVVLGARRVDRLEEIAQQVRQMGRRAGVVRCDVDRDADVQTLVATAVKMFGRVDVLFANAGYGIYASVLDTTDAQHRQIFETNYFGTLRAVKAAADAMRQQDYQSYRGHIVVCSSAASEVGPPLCGAYAATKAAQDGLASALRAELAEEDIYVTTVHPVPTTTEFSDRARREAGHSLRKPFPGPKHQTAEHVAACIVRCLRHPRAEVWPHFWSRLGVGIAAAFPSLPAWALRRYMRKLR